MTPKRKVYQTGITGRYASLSVNVMKGFKIVTLNHNLHEGNTMEDG